MTPLTEQEAKLAVDHLYEVISGLACRMSMAPELHIIVAQLDGEGGYVTLYESPDHESTELMKYSALRLAGFISAMTPESWRQMSVDDFKSFHMAKTYASGHVDSHIFVVVAAEPIDVASGLATMVLAECMLFLHAHNEAGAFEDRYATLEREEPQGMLVGAGT
jgi:hypothetical protein